MFEKKGAGIKGVVGGAADIVGGGLISGFGKAIGGLADVFGLGGTPEAVKEEGRKTAEKFVSGGPNATSLPVNDTTIALYGFPAKPSKGEFYIWRATGQVYAVTSYSGMVPHSGAWADQVKKQFLKLYNPKTNKILTLDQYTRGATGPLNAATLGGMPAILAVGVVLALAMRGK